MSSRVISTIAVLAMFVLVVAFLQDIYHDSTANFDIVVCCIGVMAACGLVFMLKLLWEDV